jgi:hypothetical protein
VKTDQGVAAIMGGRKHQFSVVECFHCVCEIFGAQVGAVRSDDQGAPTRRQAVHQRLQHTLAKRALVLRLQFNREVLTQGQAFLIDRPRDMPAQPCVLTHGQR